MIDDTTLATAATVLDDYRAAGLMLATAESCTGGLIAASLTHWPGSSDVVERGFVTYSNAAKHQSLGVSWATIARHGAVSEQVARAMAEGALAHSPADVAIAVTGIAGPGGGGEDKPVGLVWFALARRGVETVAEREVFPGSRAEVRRATVIHALAMLDAGLERRAPSYLVSPARSADLMAVADLVNKTYRGPEAWAGWTHEADLIDGDRTDLVSLTEDLSGPNQSMILCLRDHEGGPILACVFLEDIPHEDGTMHCFLGMLSVAPERQRHGLGRLMLEHAEQQARAWGAASVSMLVISIRIRLIEWYERRGYERTGATMPFPYNDASVGIPRSGGMELAVLKKDL